MPRTNWTTDPRAIALLAAMRANPPEIVWCSQVFTQTREDWPEYRGDLVDRLDAIRDEYGEASLQRTFDTGSQSHLTRWSALGTVHEVIAAALEPLDMERAA